MNNSYYIYKSVYLLLFLFLACNVSKQTTPQLECGDLLAEYANIPNNIEDKLHFVQCERINTQTAAIKASYMVKKEDITLIEDYFASTYNLPKLNWIDKECYDGKCIRAISNYGGVKFEPEKISELYLLHKDLLMTYDLRGYYDIMQVSNKTKLDQNQISQYTLEISIAEQP